MNILFTEFVLLYLVFINTAAFFMFGFDKRQSFKSAWRVSERSMLMLAFSFGSLGTLLGQQVFRHKTQKQPFRVILLCIAIFHSAIAGTLLYSSGQ